MHAISAVRESIPSLCSCMQANQVAKNNLGQLEFALQRTYTLVMYVRVKREKTTLFVEIEPQETGLELKSKLQKLLEGKVQIRFSSARISTRARP